MAIYTSRTVTQRYVEFAVPVDDGHGVPVAEVSKAISAAWNHLDQIGQRRFDDSIRVFVHDDELVLRIDLGREEEVR